MLFGYTFPTTWACSGLTPVRARPWRANKESGGSENQSRRNLEMTREDTLWHGGPFNHIGQFCFFIAFPFVYMMFLIYYSAYRIRSIKLNFRKFADTPYVSSTCKKATTQIKSTAGTTGK